MRNLNVNSAEPARVVCLEHAPFERAGAIAPWMQARGHAFTSVRLWAGEPLPAANEVDWLVVMGGPMNVDDVAAYPWLKPVRGLIAGLVAGGVPVLGICLGAQLVARAMGGAVTRGPSEEIGWFPVRALGRGADIFGVEAFDAFHWHGDTFDIPAGAERIAGSAACANQGFVAGSALALQFHLETTPASARQLIDHCDWTPGATAQTAARMLGSKARFEALNQRLARALDWQARSWLA